MNSGLRFLRPYLCSTVLPVRGAAHAAFATQAGELRTAASTLLVEQREDLRSGDVRQRIKELQEAGVELHPRLRYDARAMTCRQFFRKYKTLEPGKTREEDVATVRGILRSCVQKDVAADSPRKGHVIAQPWVEISFHGYPPRRTKGSRVM